MQFLTVNGVTIHARIEGDARAMPLVMVHPLGTDLRLWNRLARYLADRLRLVRFDQRGHGLSGLATPPYSLDELAGDAAGLMDQLDIGPAVICGVSLGGLVALRLADRRPDLVRGLVLIGTANRIGTSTVWQARIDAIRALGLPAVVDDVLSEWFPPELRAARPEEIAGWRAMLTRTPADGYVGAAAALDDANVAGPARALRVPTLCLAGERDGAISAEAATALARKIPRARLQFLAGAGHLACVDQPAAVAASILGFLEAEGLA